MKNTTKWQLILVASVIFIGILGVMNNSQGAIQSSLEEEDNPERENGNDGDDLSKTLGLAAIILFGLVITKALVFFIYDFIRKLPDTTDSRMKLKNSTKTFFLKTRPILKYTHYIAGTAAIVLLYIHGISLIGENLPRTINGIITAVILTLYVLTGLIAKFKLKLFWNSSRWKKWTMKLHRSLPLFVFIILFHLLHLLLDD